MGLISIDKTGPKAFILAPDGQFSAFDPEHDQLWTLNLDPPDSYPFQLQTTFHLRARSMRVFPNLILEHHRLKNHTDFSLPPTVKDYSPSSIKIEYNFNHQVLLQFCSFLPEPNVLIGALYLKNISSQPLSLTAEMAAILTPMAQGRPIHPDTIGHNHLLVGQAEELFPLLFMCGGPTGTSNPYPALHVPLTLSPGQSEDIQWALTSKTSQTSSYEAARHWLAQDWQRDYQIHTKAHQKKMITITTGQPDWDAAFYLAQVNARSHLVTSDPSDPQAITIRPRLKDDSKNTYNMKNKHPELTLLDALHLSQALLPAHSELFSRLLEDFITRIDDQGFLSTQGAQVIISTATNACPLLASLCLMLYEINPEAVFLQRVFPYLQRFFDVGWFKNAKPEHAELPAWEVPEQLQLDSGLFNFDIWRETGIGLDIHSAHSPALAAMLLREAAALKKIAQILGDRPARNGYDRWIKNLQEKINSLWDDTCKIFGYQDAHTHKSPSRELYYPGRIQDKVNIGKHFSQPQRLQINLFAAEKVPKTPLIRLEGKNSTGEMITELIEAPEMFWVANRAHVTTRQIFSTLDHICFNGFNPDDRFLIQTADYSQTDISCLLPIWSGGIRPDQLAMMIENITDNPSLSGEFGIPETWRCRHPLPDGLSTPVNIQWNTLILDGLVKEGFSKQAMTLFSILMTPILRGLKEFSGFYPRFDDKTGLPIGAANTIAGLVPVGLFLKIAGIRLLSPDRVAIWGENPFPWPVEVSWQGLGVCKEGSETQIIFPDGTQYHSRSTKPRIITSKKS
ncbi:MAG TPA: hypothetical protein PLA02_00690 [Brevefilum fermentans]|nr:hypothetical protein [Brevefilum fermentans]